jgi:SAM-dependent methyltransferase
MGKIEYEVDYWVRAGQYQDDTSLKNITGEVLRNFDLTLDDLKDKIILDAGSGPFGGITYSAVSCKEAIAVDPLFENFEKAKVLKLREGVRRIDKCIEDVPLDSVPPCDYIFSINALDHSPHIRTNNVERSVNNMLDMLKIGGLLCIMVHLRAPTELNRGHDFVINENIIKNILDNRCKVIKWDHGDISSNRKRRKTLMAKAERIK